MKKHQTGFWNLVASTKVLSIKVMSSLVLLALVTALIPTTAEPVMAQGIRRPGKAQRQIQKKLDRQGADTLTPAGESPSPGTKAQTTTGGQGQPQGQRSRIDGISNRDPRTLFTREEMQMAIPGFGSPPALLVLLRQLELTQDQKDKFRALRQRIGTKLQDLQRDRRQLEAQLEEAIYGEEFNPQRVDELAAQSADKTAEIIKTQASIESQIRQILTPDQFFAFRFLVGEIVLPQRRMTPQQLRQQQLRRLGPGANQNRPNQQPPAQKLPDNDN